MSKKDIKTKYKKGRKKLALEEDNTLSPSHLDELLNDGITPPSDAELLAKSLLDDAAAKGLSAADVVKQNDAKKHLIDLERKQRKKALMGRNIVMSKTQAAALLERLSNNEGGVPFTRKSKDELGDTAEFDLTDYLNVEKTKQPADDSPASEKKPKKPRKKKGADQAAKNPEPQDDTVTETQICETESADTADSLNAQKPPQPQIRENRKLATKIIASFIFSLLLFVPLFFFAVTDAAFYYIYNDGERAGFTFSFSKINAENAAAHNIGVSERDVVTVTPTYKDISVINNIEVSRAFAVTVTADGGTREVYLTRGATAREAIDRACTPLGEDDIVSIPLDQAVKAGDEIIVSRVTLLPRTVFEDMPYEEVTKLSPLLPDGVKRIMNEGGGLDGTAYVDYVDRFIDGVYDDTEQVGLTYEDVPHNVVTLEGKSGVPASSLDAAKYTDVAIVDNAPTSYKSVTVGAPCTAYSFKPGVYGSSGMRLVQGMVAVDPNEYSYGDLLYITSADGSFVYGWAIVADACEAAMYGDVAIDCFFETYGESVLFGKRYLNVYVVDTLNQEQLTEYTAHEGMFNLRVPE